MRPVSMRTVTVKIKMGNPEYNKQMALGHKLYKRGLYRRASNAFSAAACVYFSDDAVPETFTRWRDAVRMQRKALTKAEQTRTAWLANAYGGGKFLDPECPLAGRCEVGGGSGFAIR